MIPWVYAGVPTRIDAAHTTSHEVIVSNGETVIMGSLKFTKSLQEDNAENVLIVHASTLAAPYAQNWQVHAKHTQSYVGREVRQ